MKRVLFVCVENSNRSQMSEAFARILGGDNIEAYSAGSSPSGVINPKAITSMNEIGYDLSTHSSKSLEGFSDTTFDLVATMGCGDTCSSIKTKHLVDWSIPDPKHLPPDEFRAIRNMIKDKVEAALTELDCPPAYTHKPMQ